VPAVRVDEADDSIAKPLAALLDAGGPGGRLVIRAGQLKAASRLRKLVEGHDAALAVLFTEPGPEARMALARTRLQAGAGASREAIALLGELLPADSAAATQELDKLLLFADGQAIDADMVRCAVGDAAADRIDNALIAAFDGDAAGASRAWRRLEADGTAAMQLIRAAGNHLHQLLQITSAGTSPPQAVAGLRPPAFGPRRDALLRHARSWPQASLMRALARVDDAELAFKRGRLPERLAGRHLYWMLAMHARQLNKGQRR
jgi:DNA polymerase-3 subunit delta